MAVPLMSNNNNPDLRGRLRRREEKNNQLQLNNPLCRQKRSRRKVNIDHRTWVDVFLHTEKTHEQYDVSTNNYTSLDVC